MPSLFKRLTHYCESTKSKMLSAEQRAELGRIVCDKYVSVKHPKTIIHSHTYTNEEGSFKVICYPKLFIPTIDDLIKQYYEALPKPKERKRIPARKLAYTSNKPFKNG